MKKFALAALPLALAACQQSPDRDVTTSDTEGTDEPAEISSDAAAAPTASVTATPSTASAASTIPPGIQGRWGMVPADCTSTRGDAKGLLTIGPKTLRFYESAATLQLETARSDTMIRGQFAFTGEGITWTRDITLTASNGGKTLTRLDRGGEEPGGPFTYSKCAA